MWPNQQEQQNQAIEHEQPLAVGSEINGTVDARPVPLDFNPTPYGHNPVTNVLPTGGVDDLKTLLAQLGYTALGEEWKPKADDVTIVDAKDSGDYGYRFMLVKSEGLILQLAITGHVYRVNQ